MSLAAAALATPNTTVSNSRNVRCLIVGEDLVFGLGCFALSVDEDMTVDQLTEQVMRHIPSDSQERIGSELQLFKGFDLYTASPTATPVKPRRQRQSLDASPIDELLHSVTPEKTANRYFQRKYAMRKRASLGEYLPRGRKCERSRIDVLVSVPKFQLSEDLAAMESEDETENETEPDSEMDFGVEDFQESEPQQPLASTPLKRKRDPVVDEAAAHGAMPAKWQRAPCGRVVSAGSLRLRGSCAHCRQKEQSRVVRSICSPAANLEIFFTTQ